MESSSPNTRTSTATPNSDSSVKGVTTTFGVLESSLPNTRTSIACVPVIATVGVSFTLLTAALIVIVIIRKRKTNAGGERELNLEEGDGDDLHYAAIQHLNPLPAGAPARHPEDRVTYSTIVELSGGEDQDSNRSVGTIVDPNALYATVQKDRRTQC